MHIDRLQYWVHNMMGISGTLSMKIFQYLFFIIPMVMGSTTQVILSWRDLQVSLKWRHRVHTIGESLLLLSHCCLVCVVLIISVFAIRQY